MKSGDWPELPEIPTAELPAEGWDSWLLSLPCSALDQVILRCLQLLVMDNMTPSPAELSALEAEIKPYVTGELWENPRRFFAFVDTPVAPVTEAEKFRRFVDGCVIMAREFTTAYAPYQFRGARKPEASLKAVDNRVYVEHWMHEPGTARATVLALHGFASGNPRVDAVMLFASQLFRHGFDVALMTLPAHGARKPPGATFSGERFGMPRGTGVNEAVRQSIYEIHMMAGWLREQCGAPVGLLGMSLGGYLSALAAGLTGDWDFVIPMVPPVCMGDLVWRFLHRRRLYWARRSVPFTREQLRAIYRVHSPLTYPLAVDKSRVLIVAARGDQFVPPEHPHALWLHWRKPEIFWFAGSHTAPVHRSRVVARVLAHLDRVTGTPRRAAGRAA